VNSIATAVGLLILGQADGPVSAAAQASSTSQIQSIWDFVVKGGPMMIPIGICSLVALAVIIERLMSLRRRNVTPPDFLSGMRAVLDEGLDDKTAALEYCRNDGSPVANIFAAGIKRLSEPIELLEKHIQEAGQREVLKLRKFLRLLSVIASIAPLMGLLGTIFGMIKAFQTVAMSGEALGKAELLAKGIYEAMITTAAGLLVAIPALIGYHWISAKIENLVAEMDQLTCEFVEDYAGIEPAPTDTEAKLRPVHDAKDAREPESGDLETAAASA
jgi:biopolymer transport protein ExbB